MGFVPAAVKVLSPPARVGALAGKKVLTRRGLLTNRSACPALSAKDATAGSIQSRPMLKTEHSRAPD
jgi:hypothetical protein